jgi:hypothetical protein
VKKRRRARVNLGSDLRNHRDRSREQVEAAIELLFPSPPADCKVRLKRLMRARAHIAAAEVHDAAGKQGSSTRLQGARRLLERESTSFDRSCMR